MHVFLTVFLDEVYFDGSSCSDSDNDTELIKTVPQLPLKEPQPGPSKEQLVSRKNLCATKKIICGGGTVPQNT